VRLKLQNESDNENEEPEAEKNDIEQSGTEGMYAKLDRENSRHETDVNEENDGIEMISSNQPNSSMFSWFSYVLLPKTPKPLCLALIKNGDSSLSPFFIFFISFSLIRNLWRNLKS